MSISRSIQSEYGAHVVRLRLCQAREARQELATCVLLKNGGKGIIEGLEVDP